MTTRGLPFATIPAQVIPHEWTRSSNDLQARLWRAGLDGTPVVVATDESPWGLRHTTPTHRLLDVLDAAPEVGALVAEALTNHREGKLDQALRTRTAVPGQPNVGDGAALLAILLSRAVLHDGQKPIAVEVLDELGPEGAAVGRALKDAVDAIESGGRPLPTKPSTSGAWETDGAGAWIERQLTLRQKIDRLAPWLEREATLAGLTPPAATPTPTPTPMTAPVDAVDDQRAIAARAAAAQVTGAATATAAAAAAASAVTLPSDLGDRLPQARLLGVLGFGGGAALQIAARELAGAPGLLDKKPEGVSGFLLRQRGEKGLAGTLRALVRRDAPVDDPAVVGAALVRLLARYPSSTTKGQIDWARFAADFGATGAAIARALGDAAVLGEPPRPNYAFSARVVEELRTAMAPDAARPLIDALVRESGLIPRNLAVLDVVKARVADDAVAGRGLVAVQHLFPTIVPMIEALIEKGMDPSQMFILGTPYASNPLVAAYLRTLGVRVMLGTDVGGNTRAFEEHRVGEVHRFLGEVVRTTTTPANGWKILDDGGMLQTIIAGDKPAPDGGIAPATLKKLFDPQFTDAVEQTTRGITELKKQPMAYRTVAVASSAPKIREGDVIGWSLAEALLLESTQAGRLSAQARVGVVSAGTIGLHAARHLRDAGFSVEVVDTKAEARTRAQAAGFVAHDSVDDVSDHVDVILSCTGHTALRGDMLQGFEGALLSGSSAAIEFDVAQIDSHRSEDITILNRGRPANFHGDGYENLSAENIAITRALLFTAVTQDVAGQAPGLIDLDHDLGALAEQTWDARGGPKTPRLDRARPPSTTATKRPDTIAGAARHDEWMAYLARLPRPVCPPPNQVGERPGLYLFTDDDDRVRAVDTSHGGFTGAASQPVALPSVPRSAIALNEPDARNWYVDGVGGDGRKWFATLTRDAGGALQAAAPRPFDARVDVRTEGAAHPDARGPRLHRGVVVVDDATLHVGLPGGGSFVSAPRKGAGEAFFLRAPQEVVLELQKKPARVFVHDTLGGSPVARHYERTRLPADVRTIEAVLALPATEVPLVVGRSADGTLVAAALTPGGDQRAIRLPKDAVFRGVHRPDESRPFDVVVDYTLPGDAVELESLRHAKLTLA
jgi:S-adenosylhomocysteine hydrolase